MVRGVLLGFCCNDATSLAVTQLMMVRILSDAHISHVRCIGNLFFSNMALLNYICFCSGEYRITMTTGLGIIVFIMIWILIVIVFVQGLILY